MMKFLKKNTLLIVAIIIYLFSNKMLASNVEGSVDDETPVDPNYGEPIYDEPTIGEPYPDYIDPPFDPFDNSQPPITDDYWGDDAWA